MPFLFLVLGLLTLDPGDNLIAADATNVEDLSPLLQDLVIGHEEDVFVVSVS